MPAPFPLPDFATFYHPYDAVDPSAVDVACRIVPALGLLRRQLPFGLESNWIQYTHWIDWDGDDNLFDLQARFADDQGLSFSDGDRVVATLNQMEYSFVVVWVEDRFTGTVKVYRRAYLVRDTREIA